jgi:hypothetical protein
MKRSKEFKKLANRFFLSCEKTADLFGVSVKTARRWRNDGAPFHFKAKSKSKSQERFLGVVACPYSRGLYARKFWPMSPLRRVAPGAGF